MMCEAFYNVTQCAATSGCCSAGVFPDMWHTDFAVNGELDCYTRGWQSACGRAATSTQDYWTNWTTTTTTEVQCQTELVLHSCTAGLDNVTQLVGMMNLSNINDADFYSLCEYMMNLEHCVWIYDVDCCFASADVLGTNVLDFLQQSGASTYCPRNYPHFYGYCGWTDPSTTPETTTNWGDGYGGYWTTTTKTEEPMCMYDMLGSCNSTMEYITGMIYSGINVTDAEVCELAMSWQGCIDQAHCCRQMFSLMPAEVQSLDPEASCKAAGIYYSVPKACQEDHDDHDNDDDHHGGYGSFRDCEKSMKSCDAPIANASALFMTFANPDNLTHDEAMAACMAGAVIDQCIYSIGCCYYDDSVNYLPEDIKNFWLETGALNFCEGILPNYNAYREGQTTTSTTTMFCDDKGMWMCEMTLGDITKTSAGSPALMP